jgi:hypothetical protein
MSPVFAIISALLGCIIDDKVELDIFKLPSFDGIMMILMFDIPKVPLKPLNELKIILIFTLDKFSDLFKKKVT